MSDNPNYKMSEALGTTGLKQQSGYIYEEFLPRLQGEKGVKVYREMVDNSSVIGSIRYLIRALVRQVDWRIESANDSAEAKRQAEYVEGCLRDMIHTFEDLISETLSCLEYGWAYFELVYKLRKGATRDDTTRSQFNDGKWGWRKIEIRSQESWDHWEFDPETSEFLGMHQWDTYSGRRTYIPLEKALLFRTESTRGNPEGRSLYRNAVIDYHSLKRISQIELVGIERDMTGLLTMEVPVELLQSSPGTSEATLRTTLETMLSQLKRDEREYAMVPPEVDRKGMPTGYKLKLLSTGGRRQIDTNAVKLYYKISILQTVLAQFIQLGMDKAGSWALASSQTNTFSMALGAILNDAICAPFNRYAIPRLMELNDVAPDLHPELVHGDIETPPLEEVGKYLVSLATAGLDLSDPALQRKLLEIGNLPLPKEE